jgi:hypothetical protein
VLDGRELAALDINGVGVLGKLGPSGRFSILLLGSSSNQDHVTARGDRPERRLPDEPLRHDPGEVRHQDDRRHERLGGRRTRESSSRR